MYRHLEDPDAVAVEQGLDVAGEANRILQVVEHGDGGYQVETETGQPVGCAVGREHRVDDLHGRWDGGRNIGWIYAPAFEVVGNLLQQGPVIATDIQHPFLLRLDNGEGQLNEFGKMPSHGLVCPRSVPIIRVENFRWDGMRELQQAAGILAARHITPHQLGGHLSCRWGLHGRLEERALQKLLAKVDDRCQIGTTANTAASFVEDMHRFPPWRVQRQTCAIDWPRQPAPEN